MEVTKKRKARKPAVRKPSVLRNKRNPAKMTRAEIMRELEAIKRAKVHELEIKKRYVDSHRWEFFKPYLWQSKVPSLVRDNLIVLAPAPNGIGKCLTSNTLINTPDGEFSVGELYRRGMPFNVYSWDGERVVETTAKAPFKKDGLHRCYRIEMADGSVIEAADYHRILTDSGWIYVENLYQNHLQSFSETPHETSLESCRSVRVSGDQRLSERQSDYQDGYSLNHRQHDEQFLLGEDTDQVSFPSQGGVLKRISLLLRMGGLVNIYKHIPSRFCDHLSSYVYGRLRCVGRFFESLFRDVCTSLQPFYGEYRVFPRLSSVGVLEFQPFHGFGLQDPYISGSFENGQVSQFQAFCDQESHVSSLCSPEKINPVYPSPNHIVSIKPIGVKEVFDFTVPGYANYIAGGLIHHNTCEVVCVLASWLFGYEAWNEVDKDTPGAVSVNDRWFNSSSLCRKPPVRVRLTGEDWNHHLGQTVVPELKKWFPEGEYITKKNTNGIEYFWTCKNGSTLELMCIRPDQRVLMGDFTEIPIRDVSVGDMVMSSVGVTRVTQKHHSYADEFYKIRTAFGNEIICTYKHPIFTEHGWKRAVDIEVGDILVEPDFDYNSEDEIENWKLVVLGVLIGDGHIGEKEVRWACHSEGLVEWVSSVLPSNLKLKPVSKRENDYAITQVKARNNSPVISMLREYGLLGSRSKDKFIPDHIFRLSKRQKGLFLKALFSTDGTFSLSGHQVSYSSRSERLVEDIKKLLRAIGVKAQTGQYWRESHFDGYVCSGYVNVCRFGSRESLYNFNKYAGFVGKNNSWSDFVCKYAEDNKVENPRKNRVSRIDIIPGGDCLDLTVEAESHDYIVDGMIVHNTHDQDIKLFEGWRGHGWIADEPPPYAVFKAMARGLAENHGRMVLFSTPLKEAWMMDELVLSNRSDVYVMRDLLLYDNETSYGNDNKILDELGLEGAVTKNWREGDGQKKHFFDLILNVDDKGVKAEEYLRVNCAGVPDLDRKMMDLIFLRKAKDTSIDEKPSRFFGVFKKFTGIVIKQFDRTKHMVESPEGGIPMDWVITVLIDCHLSKPHAVSFYGCDKHNRHYCIDEYWINASPDELADLIIRKKRVDGWNISNAYIDPFSKGDNYMKNKMAVEDTFTIMSNRLSEEDIYLTAASKDKESGIRNIRNWLEGPNKIPVLYFFDTLQSYVSNTRGIIYDIQRLCFDDNGKVEKINDDFVENLYRYTLTDTEYISDEDDYELTYAVEGSGESWMGT